MWRGSQPPFPRFSGAANKLVQTPIVFVAHSMGGLVAKKVSILTPLHVGDLTATSFQGLPARDTGSSLSINSQANQGILLSRNTTPGGRFSQPRKARTTVRRLWDQGFPQ